MLDDANICNLTANSDYYYRLKKPDSEELFDHTIDSISVNSEYLTNNQIIAVAIISPSIALVAIITGVILLRFRNQIKTCFANNCFKSKQSYLYKKPRKQLKKQIMSRNIAVSLGDHTIEDGDSNYEDTTFSKIAMESLPNDNYPVLYLPKDGVVSTVNKQNCVTSTNSYLAPQLLNNYCQTYHSMPDNSIPNRLVPSLKPKTGKYNLETRTSTISNFEPFYDPKMSDLKNQDFRKLLGTIPQSNSVLTVTGDKNCVTLEQVKSVNQLNDELNVITTKIKNIEEKIFNSTNEIRDMGVQIDFEEIPNDIPLQRLREPYTSSGKIQPIMLSAGDRGKYILKLDGKKHSESLSSNLTKPYNEKINSLKVNTLPSNPEKLNQINPTLISSLKLSKYKKSKEENQWEKDNTLIKSKTSRSNTDFTRNQKATIQSKNFLPITYVSLKIAESTDSTADLSSYKTEKNLIKTQKTGDGCNLLVEDKLSNVCKLTVERLCKIEMENAIMEALRNFNYFCGPSSLKCSNLFENRNENSLKFVEKRPYSFENEIGVFQIKRNVSNISVDDDLSNTESILNDERVNMIVEQPQKHFKSSIVIDDCKTDSHFSSIEYSFDDNNYSLNIVPQSSDTDTMKNDFFRDFHIPNYSGNYHYRFGYKIEQSSNAKFIGDFYNNKSQCKKLNPGTCERNNEGKITKFCQNNHLKRYISKFVTSGSRFQDEIWSQKMNNADSNAQQQIGAAMKL